MKRVLMFLGALCCAGMVYAAVTPNKTDFVDYCTGGNNSNCVAQIDTSGNITGKNVVVQGSLSVTGTSTFSTPMGLLSQTTAQIQALTPGTTGQMIFCSNCLTFNTSKGGVCVSSGILTGAWIQVSSATAVTACQ